jgi:putative ABC transport system substrate-binding protein
MRAPRPVLTIILTIALLAAPPTAETQPAGRVYRLALVFTATPVAEMTESASPTLRAFFGELRRLGYTEGQNLVVERRSALGRPERFPEIAAEVVHLNPDVIVIGGNRAARAVKAASGTIPIVGATLSFPVEYGLVTSLARPGANLTGLTDDAGPEISAKELSLLTEAVPGTARLAYLGTTNLWNGPVGRLLRAAAQRLGVTLVPALMDGPFQEAQYVEAFRTMVGNGAQALLIGSVGEHFVNRRLIVELAAKHRLPMMAPGRVFVEDGGLLAHGINAPDNWRRAALHVERILKGAKPADLPIEQPTKFEFVVNLKTAKALGLTIPPSVLARADEVIQ